MRNSFGNNLSFEELYEEYFPKVYRYVYSCLMHRQDAEEVTAEVFMRVWQHQGTYDPSLGSLSTWIGAIARHQVQKKCALVSRQREILVGDVPEQEVSHLMLADEAMTLKLPENRQLYLLLGKLSAEEREFLELRYGLELKNKDIGRLLGISSEAVRKRFDRLLAKCCSLLGTEK